MILSFFLTAFTSGPTASTTAKQGFSFESLGRRRPEAVVSAGFSTLATTRSLSGFRLIVLISPFLLSIVAQLLALSSVEC